MYVSGRCLAARQTLSQSDPNQMSLHVTGEVHYKLFGSFFHLLSPYLRLYSLQKIPTPSQNPLHASQLEIRIEDSRIHGVNGVQIDNVYFQNF